MPQRRWLTVSLQSLSPYKNCNLLLFSALVVSFMEHYFSLSSAFAIHCLCHSRLARGISLSLHPSEDFNVILGFSAGCGSPNWSCVVLVTQLCPNLCNPMDCSPPGSSVHGIFQARIVEWVAISFSNWSWSEVKWSASVVSDSLRPHGLQPTRLLRPWDFPGKSTGVGCHFLFQNNSELNLEARDFTLLLVGLECLSLLAWYR